MRCTLVVSLSLVGLLGGCWRGVDAADPAEVAFAADASDMRSYGGSDGAPNSDAPAVGGLQVPPDRATARATVEVRAADASAAVGRAREVAEYVGGLWADDPLCSAQVVDYIPVHAAGSEAAASFAVAVAANLKGLDTTLERMERVEVCLGRFRTLAADSDLRGVQVRVGSIVSTVDDPESFRPRLLAQRLDPLRAVSSLTDVPPQFDAAGVRCSSTGEVTIVQRTLGAVTLDIDFTCSRA